MMYGGLNDCGLGGVEVGKRLVVELKVGLDELRRSEGEPL